MSHNPAFSPDNIQATTSLSQVMDKGMQETMVRCNTEIKKDLGDKGQCQCWAGGGREGNVVELSWKTAFERSRYYLQFVSRKCSDLYFLEESFWCCCGLVFC
jgi:hypothetical protein